MKYKINLIGRKTTSLFDKVLYFFLNYLRYILVITQLVVIGVLFFRFRIDQNIIDLKDSIDQKKEIITVVKPILAETQKIKTREDSIREILKDQTSFSGSLDYVRSVFPETVRLTDMTIEGSKITLKGIAFIPQHLQAFYKKLKVDKKFKTLELTDIKRGIEGYDFTLNLENYTE